MDERWMRIALEEARAAAEADEVPVGAVIVKDGHLLARAHNRREADHDPTAHAELLCLRKAAQALNDWRLRGCTLYVTLEPCPMCAGAMVMSQLTECVFGAADTRQGCCGSVYDLPGDAALQGVTRWRAGQMEDEFAALLLDIYVARREPK